jgi:hypothetical protein
MLFFKYTSFIRKYSGLNIESEQIVREIIVL